MDNFSLIFSVGEHALRQGYHLAPLLFILAMDGCFSCMYASGLCAWFAERVSDAKLPYRHSFVEIWQRHEVLFGRLKGRSPDHFYIVESICGLLGPPNQSL